LHFQGGGVPESFLGDGLVYEELLPVAWNPGPLASGLVLARLNVDNQQLLGAEATLGEVRANEALKDESPALLHELQRLEFKINVLLRLTAEIAIRGSAVPPATRVRLSSHALEWFDEQAPPPGATGMLSLYVNPALPQCLHIPCIVEGRVNGDDGAASQLRFQGLSEAVVELLDKLIFRHHRRLIAGARHASS
jgi:Atypical PilZ domain, cyclic di-GMP receptor